jgi:hypothetical protein
VQAVNAYMFAALALVLATVTAVFLLGYETGRRAAAAALPPLATWAPTVPFQGAQAAVFRLPPGAVEEQHTAEVAALWTRIEIARARR